MLKLNVIGPILDSSGYAGHTRGLTNAIYEQGITDIFIDCPKPAGWNRLVNPAEHNMFTHPFYKEGITLAITQPAFWKFHLLDKPKHFIGFLVWEGDKIPKHWIEFLMDERIDKIFVPSKHTEQAIINTLMKVGELINTSEKQMADYTQIVPKIVVVPHGVNHNIYKPISDIPKHEQFTFFCDKGWRGGMNDRGGVQFLIKAFIEEFSNKDDVQLIIKLNPAYINPKVNIHEELKKIGVEKKVSDPIIKFVTDNLGYPQLNYLYNQAHCFVTTQMADAFHLGGLQAMAVGIPTIQCDFGGQTDYMTEKNSWTIKTTPVLVDWDITYEGITWGMPDHEDIKNKLRYAFTHQEEVKTKGDQALKDSLNWSWAHSAKKVINTLKTL